MALQTWAAIFIPLSILYIMHMWYAWKFCCAVVSCDVAAYAACVCFATPCKAHITDVCCTVGSLQQAPAS